MWVTKTVKITVHDYVLPFYNINYLWQVLGSKCHKKYIRDYINYKEIIGLLTRAYFLLPSPSLAKKAISWLAKQYVSILNRRRLFKYCGKPLIIFRGKEMNLIKKFLVRNKSF